MTSSGGSKATHAPMADRDAERAVLGALLLRGEPQWARGLVAKGLKPEDFYWRSHEQVFAAIAVLADRRSAIDCVTVSAELEKQLQRAVDAWAIEELTSCAPSTGGLTEYADIVLNLAQWRRRRARAHEMLTAVEDRNVEAWNALMKVFEVSDAPSGPSGPQPRLRLVVNGDTGEVVERQEQCPECQALKDQLAGAEKDIRGWRARYMNLERKREEEAREGALWLVAQALFEIWKRKTGHTRSPFSYQRFAECEAYLRNDAYGPRAIERAIAGIAYDPWKKQRKNGSTYVHNWWEDLFKNQKVFENFVNSAPRDWKPELKIADEGEKEKKVESGPEDPTVQMKLVQESAG